MIRYFVEVLEPGSMFGIPCRMWVEVDEAHSLPAAQLVARNLGGTTRIRTEGPSGTMWFYL